MEIEKSCLYVIELEPGRDPEAKWYVGISKNPDHRYQQHRCGAGAGWVARNEIVGLYKICWCPEQFVRDMERHLTAELMEAYGKNSTRGAKYLAPVIRTYPRVETEAMPLEIAEGLRESGNEELARIATNPSSYSRTRQFLERAEEILLD